MSSFTYTQRKEDPIGASRCEVEGGIEHTCVHPYCEMTIFSALADRCPGCGGNPFKLGEHEVLTKEQLTIQRTVIQKKEELSH